MSGLLRALVRQALNEGRVDDVKKRFPGVDVDTLAASDPSGNHKYLMWMAKQVAAGAHMEDVIPTVEMFHKNSGRLKERDINRYATAWDLENAIKDLGDAPQKGSKRKQRMAAKSSAPVVMDDPEGLLIRPDSKDACVEYGKGTRWCITMRDASFYEQYKMSNVVFYFLFPKVDLGQGPNWEKIAFAVQRGKENQVLRAEFFLANDDQVKLEQLLAVTGDLGARAIAAAEADAPKQPTGFLARLKKGDYAPEEFVEYFKNAGEPSTRRKLLEFARIPELVALAPWARAQEDKKERLDFVQALYHEYIQLSYDDREAVKPAFAFFADDSDPQVSTYVYDMVKDDPVAVQKYLENPSADVRMKVAADVDWPVAVRLANDEDPRVRQVLVNRAMDGGLSPDEDGELYYQMAELGARDPNPVTRKLVASTRSDDDPRLEKIIASMADDPDESVRLAVASNWMMPQEVYLKLIADPSEIVRRRAVARIDDDQVLVDLLSGDSAMAKHAARSMEPSTATEVLKSWLPKRLEGERAPDGIRDDVAAELVLRVPSPMALKLLDHVEGLRKAGVDVPGWITTYMLFSLARDPSSAKKFGEAHASELSDPESELFSRLRRAVQLDAKMSYSGTLSLLIPGMIRRLELGEDPSMGPPEWQSEQGRGAEEFRKVYAHAADLAKQDFSERR